MILLSIALCAAALKLIIFASTPFLSKNQTTITFLYFKNTSISQLAHNLNKIGVLKSPYLFTILAYINNNWRYLKSGEYEITASTTPKQLLKQLSKGEERLHAFTIVEGWTFKQMTLALRSNPYVDHTLYGLSDNKIMESIGHPGVNPEGLFAPDTYLFHMGFKDTELLQLAYKLCQKRLLDTWEKRDKNAPYKSPYEALKSASIIEKETALNKEKFKISGVIARRIKRGIPLALDPTLIYGLNNGQVPKKTLTSQDLTKDTPYNTYLHKGLPITPISMPGYESIYAALHPLSGNELYFVSKGDGSHKFSATLKEQSTAIQKYIKKVKNNNINKNDKKRGKIKKAKKTQRIKK